MMESAYSKIKRRYFEAFGDIEEENRFLRKLTFSMAALILIFLFFVFGLSKRPPVVIRVTEVRGAEVIRDLKTNNLATSHEMIGFAKRFAARYTAYNSYTIKRDMAEAFNQMTGRFQKGARRKMIDSGFLDKVTQAGIDTKLEFKEAKMERDSEHAAVISLVGVRRVFKYGSEDFIQEVLFKADLVLKKVDRTESVPDGVLVDQYTEILLNDLTERK